MIDSQWMLSGPVVLISMAFSGIGLYVVLLWLTRLAGLRSFSKMSGFDFAITVASGTVLASTMLAKQPSLLTGAVALALLFAMQYVVARGRRRWPAFERLVDNEPLVLMAGERLLTDNMAMARITEADLNAKLRLAGVTHRNQILAVILETTGDVSVLTVDKPVDPRLFVDVRDSQQIERVSTTSV